MVSIPVGFHLAHCTPGGDTLNPGSDVHFYIISLSCFCFCFYFLLFFFSILCFLFSSLSGKSHYSDVGPPFDLIIFSLLLFTSFSLSPSFWRFPLPYLIILSWIFHFYNISISKNSLLYLSVLFVAYFLIYLIYFYTVYFYYS